jgi:LysM repeat protein
MVGRSARFLAPIALAAVAVGVYLIVHSALTKHHTTPTTPTTAVVVGSRRQSHRAVHHPKYYIVKAGDTLSEISAKTGVSVDTLATLNPSVAPPSYSLQAGQRLRLRR